MGRGVTAYGVLWFTAGALLLTEAARPNNLTCPAGCDCSQPNTLFCDHRYVGTSFPTVEGNDLVNFFFAECRFAVNLSTVPYTNAEQLSLDNCGVAPNIGASSLTRLTRLRILNIRGNRHLEEVHAEAFANLTALESLDLSANNLRALPTHLFAGLGRLTFVDLSGNRRLGNLPDDLFDTGTSAITGFVCNDCGLNAVPTKFLARTSHLTRLELNENNLTVVERATFAGLRSLEELALDSSRLAILDAAAFSGLEATLTKLRLGRNRILSVDVATISQLRTLRHLELDDNLLIGIEETALPRSLFESGSPPAVLMLGNNPWHCYCNLFWLRKLNVTEPETVICTMPTSVKGRPLYGVEEDVFCAEKSSKTRDSSKASSYAVAAIVCSSLGLLALVIAVVYRCCVNRRLRASPARYANGGYYSSPKTTLES